MSAYAPIVLDTTSLSLTGVLAAGITTNSLRVVVCFIDKVANEEQPVRASNQRSELSTTNAVTICDAPTSDNVTREIFYIGINNADTVNATARVAIAENGSSVNYRLATRTLATNDTIIFTASAGWHVITAV